MDCRLPIWRGYNDCCFGGMPFKILNYRHELRLDKSIENGLELFYWRDGGRDSMGGGILLETKALS